MGLGGSWILVEGFGWLCRKLSELRSDVESTGPIFTSLETN